MFFFLLNVNVTLLGFTSEHFVLTCCFLENPLTQKSTEKTVTDCQRTHKRAEPERLRIARKHQRELESKQRKLEKVFFRLFKLF